MLCLHSAADPQSTVLDASSVVPHADLSKLYPPLLLLWVCYCLLVNQCDPSLCERDTPVKDKQMLSVMFELRHLCVCAYMHFCLTVCMTTLCVCP